MMGVFATPSQLRSDRGQVILVTTGRFLALKKVDSAIDLRLHD